MREIGFSYEYIDEDQKKKIVEIQLKDLEASHFSMTLIEPSKLNQPDQHIQWRQQKLAIENQIKKLREYLSQISEMHD
jgi:hypothetical protein